MFDPTSRYASLPLSTLVATGPEGEREVRFVTRRFIPDTTGSTTLVEHTVARGERLDTITARYLGDPTAYWRVADANGALRPEELAAEPGERIRIALPQG